MDAILNLITTIGEEIEQAILPISIAMFFGLLALHVLAQGIPPLKKAEGSIWVICGLVLLAGVGDELLTGLSRLAGGG